MYSPFYIFLQTLTGMRRDMRSLRLEIYKGDFSTCKRVLSELERAPDP